MRPLIIAGVISLLICEGLSQRIGTTTQFGLNLGGLNRGLWGTVHYARPTMLQISNFLMPSKVRQNDAEVDLSRHKITFVAFNTESQRTLNHRQIWQRVASPDGEFLQLIDLRRPSTFPLDKNVTLLVEFDRPLQEFDFVGPAYDISDDRDEYLAGVSLKPIARLSLGERKVLPLPDATKGLAQRNIIGGRLFYGVDSGPLEILDQRRIRVPDFSFQANIPPDGWFFGVTGAGAGPSQENGLKLLIEGKDTPNLHCSMRNPFTRQTVTVVLPEGTSVYDLRYFGVFCYEVGVDFGSVPVRVPRNEFIQPFLPPQNVPEKSGPPAWPRPILIPEERSDITFTLGIPKGVRIKAMRGICDELPGIWWANEVASPEIWLRVDAEYEMKILGGPSHPLYLTSEGSGGYAQKPRHEKQKITNYAGETGSVVGQPACVIATWNEPDQYADFKSFITAARSRRGGIRKQCGNPAAPPEFHRPGEIVINSAFWRRWRSQTWNRPGLIYYQSYSAFNMGGPIKICSHIDVRAQRCDQDFAALF